MTQRAFEPLCAAVFLTGCIVGGSSAPDRVLPIIPELLCLPLFVCTALAWNTAQPRSRMSLWVTAAIVGLPALQLLPLPPALWTLFPGRAEIAQAYSSAALARPWLPISLTPALTEGTLLGILPALSLFLATPFLAATARRRMMHLALVVGVLDVFLGLAQLVGGESSALRFYTLASRTDAVGFFANRNHHALFLAILILFTGPLAASAQTTAERAWLAVAGAILLLGIAASGSRAGLALGAGACLATAWIVIASRPGLQRARAVVAWAGLLAVPLLIGLMVFGATLARFQIGSLSGDLRWQIARTTWHVLVSVFPVGSGFGSFERMYARFEKPDELMAAVVNNAHNDWLEVTLEGGLPALLLLAAVLAYLVRETFMGRPSPDQSRFGRALQRATLVCLWLCALHSTVDYPLRTMAVNILVALACGLRMASYRQDKGVEASAPRNARGAHPSRITSPATGRG